VVKSNGVLVAERGVRTDPPLGKAAPWPAAVRAAVRRLDQLWTVEMAIPREAFGAEAGASCWGANFTRYATAGAEASSWSGAARYFYDPRNLGALWVPAEPTPHSAPAGTP